MQRTVTTPWQRGLEQEGLPVCCYATVTGACRGGVVVQVLETRAWLEERNINSPAIVMSSVKSVMSPVGDVKVM